MRKYFKLALSNDRESKYISIKYINGLSSGWNLYLFDLIRVFPTMLRFNIINQQKTILIFFVFTQIYDMMSYLWKITRD